jgi:hypothetical protein
MGSEFSNAFRIDDLVARSRGVEWWSGVKLDDDAPITVVFIAHAGADVDAATIARCNAFSTVAHANVFASWPFPEDERTVVVTERVHRAQLARGRRRARGTMREPMLTVSPTLNGPRAATTSSSDPPGMYCITRYGSLRGVKPDLNNATMFGFPVSRPAAAQSRRNRFWVPPSGRRWMTFTATARSNSISRARKTVEKPPRPISRTSS